MCGSLFTEDTTGNLGQTIDNLCYLGTEDVLNILGRVVRVLYNIVQQCRTDAGRPQTYLFTGYLCYCDGVHNVGLATKATHAFMSLSCKIECLGDEVHFLAVARCQIAVQQSLERIIYQFVVCGLAHLLLFIHSRFLLIVSFNL